ncbi:DUF3108 domain-containing protein [Bdellovibrio bacteriovorus]|uniref:DUF3108 domain-containing protein n=1 Tax=Bdellovibrio bacteriovorus TaxID=959 RepID=UPI0021D087F3|nr:DUF3108 domain-containing protein [Bdellovibrio bacteriovorus]UXR64026.1 DUF3108 domain-containing protein [Bdellovibrio bacteriovorus]
MNLKLLLGALTSALLFSACSTSFLKYDKADQLKKNEEFEEAVKIVKQPVPETTEAAPAETPAPVPAPEKSEPVKATAAPTPKAVKKTPGKKTPAKKSAKTPAKKTDKSSTSEAAVRQPELEDSVGFNGRRPVVDPFREGEEVVHDVHYFKVSAGELRMKVEPFAMVNNRKAYTFAVEIKTSSLFSTFYSVEDRVETFVDFEDLVPRVFQLHVKESGQLREAKMLFDTDKGLATFWEKKVTKEDGENEKKETWDILPYTQNVYSAIFYMRNFQWETGKEYSFRVGNDKENLVFSGKALRREVLDTKLGPMKAIVIQPNITLKGKFKPIGDNFIWLSDDDRRYILRIESKIKIGTLISGACSRTSATTYWVFAFSERHRDPEQ